MKKLLAVLIAHSPSPNGFNPTTHPLGSFFISFTPTPLFHFVIY